MFVWGCILFPTFSDLLFSMITLQGTNISPKNGILKMICLFPMWDTLIPWRVVAHSHQEDLSDYPAQGTNNHIPLLKGTYFESMIFPNFP